MQNFHWVLSLTNHLRSNRPPYPCRFWSILLHVVRSLLLSALNAANGKAWMDVPVPMIVALISGGGILSKTPKLTSPAANKLPNSTARCCISNSRFVEKLANITAIRSCCVDEVGDEISENRADSLDAAVRTNCRTNVLAYGEFNTSSSRSTSDSSVTFIGHKLQSLAPWSQTRRKLTCLTSSPSSILPPCRSTSANSPMIHIAANVKLS